MIIAGSASAAPFASKIAVDKKSVSAGETITVSYFLNEAADTVAVELLNGSGTVVATASTTGKAAGTNSASLVAPGAAGSNYRVRVTAAGNRAATGIMYGKQSGATSVDPAITVSSVFTNFSPRSLLAVTDQDNDNFGRLMAGSSLANSHGGYINFDAGLNFLTSTSNLGLDTATCKLGDQASAKTPMIMGASFDPNGPGSGLYSIGQYQNASPNSRNVYKAASLDTATATDVSTGFMNGLYARGGTAFKGTDGKTYCLVANGGAFALATLDEGTQTLSAGVNVMSGLTYAKGAWVFGDKVYMVDRTKKLIYRFSKATVQAATAGSLTPATAEATYDVTACVTGFTTSSADGPTYLAVSSTGAVVALAPSAVTTTGAAVIYLGTGAETGLQTLTSANVLYSIAVNKPNVTYGACAFDAADNLICSANGSESIYAIGFAGASNVAVKAPVSQNITVTAGISDYALF